MQRQRKKDLNLKPNRVLDKRSSRGMIYENEELRLRTLAIADDVDRGHSDIKKLRRENDHLKRELWALRDECEKLEEILKRIISTGNFDPSELPYPELFVEYGLTEGSLYDEGPEGRSGSCSRKGSFQGQEEGFGGTLFCSEDGDGDDTGSVIHQHQDRGQGQGQGVETEVELHPQPGQVPGELDCPGTGSILEQCGGAQYLPSAGKFLGPDLEPLEEERESRCTSLANIPPPTTTEGEELPQNRDARADSDELPDPHNLVLEDHHQESSLDHPPVIQITGPILSSSSSPNESPPPHPHPLIDSTPSEFQEGGCIADISAKYEVTSQLDIQPVTTPTMKKKSCSSILKLRHPSQPSNPSSSPSSQPHRHSFHSSATPTGPTAATPHHRISSSSSSPRFCPSCYQSEPILSLGDGLLNGLLGPHPHVNPTQTSTASCWWWTTGLEKVLAVGVVSAGSAAAAIGQDIIDELESCWDPSLERVRGIRVLGLGVFLRLRDPEAVASLLNKFGQNPLRVSGSNITFHHGSLGCTELRLMGLGPEVPDDAVVSLLNGYGQVVGPVQRVKYKGVEVWEREVKLHLVPDKGLPATLSLGGYTLSLHILNPSNPNIGSQTESKICADVNLDKCQLPVTLNHVNQSHANTKSDLVVTPSNNESTILTTTPTPSAVHKPIGRCSSSNPRLELGPSPSSPIPQQKRVPSASICASTLPPEDHPGRLFQKNPNLHKTSAAGGSPVAGLKSASSTTPNSAPNLAPTPTPPSPVGKKPLTRLLKSSPGSLIPPTPTLEGAIVAPTAPESPAVQQQHSSPRGGFRAAFNRGLSMDPFRRGSKDSTGAHLPLTLLENNNLPPNTGTAKDMRRASAAFYSRFGSQRHPHGHMPLSQMNSSSSSHNSHGGGYETTRGGVGGMAIGKGEPLPWCGCWGNGCI